jgi:uncharacterized protein YbjQ (UPF0145 family)
MKKLFIIISSFIFLFGCARIRTDFAPLGTDVIGTKLGADILLTTGDPDRPYKEMGVIFVKGRHVGYEKVMEKLQSRAKELGADAVIKIEFADRYWSFHRPYCRGVAVKFLNKNIYAFHYFKENKNDAPPFK